MGNMLFEKILRRMKEKGDLNSKAFTREMSFVRFDKQESMAIAKDMQRRGMLEMRPNGRRDFTIIVRKPRRR